MKKTLITLAALAVASVASAEVVTLKHSYTMDGTVGTSAATLTDSTGSANLSATNGLTAQYNADGSVTKTSGVTTSWTGSWSDMSSSSTWALTLDFSYPSTQGNRQAVVSVWGADGETKQLAINVGGNANGSEFCIGYGPNGAGTGDFSSSIDSSAGTTYTFTLISTTSALSLYVDDLCVLTQNYGSSSMPSASTAISNIKLGSAESNLYGTKENTTFDNLMIYTTSSSASASEVYAAIQSSQAVPEPATATLSLLALAGLAARRRRK